MPPISVNKTCWFIFQNDRLLISKSTETHGLIVFDHHISTEFHYIRHYHLTPWQDYDIHCAELTADAPLSDDYETIPLKKALEILGDDWYTIAVKAYMIINWDKNHQYCGRCGQATTHRRETFERFCKTCDLNFYPRISPSIIVSIMHEDKILMARGHHFRPGVYGLIAGFVEPGESVEETVHREVLEEVNVRITDLTYFGSQAWPFPDSLMIGFTAHYLDGDIKCCPKEIEDAGWYRYDALPGRPSTSISIAGKLLDHSIQHLQQKYEG